MNRALARLLIASLLALAIPAQGLAAVSAGLCMALGTHHEQGRAPVMDHDHAAGQHAAPEDHHNAGADSSPKPEKSSDSAHCPPCVSCCAAAVIAPAIPPAVREQPASVAIAAMPYSVPGVLPDQLDRPPLSL